MGRPAAVGLRHVPWDVGILHNDNRIDKLIGSQGASGFLVYFDLVQRAAEMTGYYYPYQEDDAPVLARKLGGGVTSVCVEQTVKFCLRIGLFDKNLYDREGVLSSEMLQRDFVVGIRGRRRDSVVVREYWLLDDEKLPGVVFCTKKQYLHTANPDLQQLKPSFFAGEERRGDIPLYPPRRNQSRRNRANKQNNENAKVLKNWKRSMEKLMDEQEETEDGTTA